MIMTEMMNGTTDIPMTTMTMIMTNKIKKEPERLFFLSGLFRFPVFLPPADPQRGLSFIPPCKPFEIRTE